MKEKNLVKLNKKSKELAKGKRKEHTFSLGSNSSEVLEQVYAALGGVQGSVIYWRNHEEDFRNNVESKFLTKQVLKEAATAQGQEVAKNIFMTFIQNNGLSENKKELPQVEAQIIDDNKN